jgi:hypothetical protein
MPIDHVLDRPAFRANTDPSPLLIHIAGEFAPAIAQLWPQPHAPFLTAEAPRRHLVCLALTDSLAEEPAFDLMLSQPLRQVINRVFYLPPAGLERALRHMAEIAWGVGDYHNLLALLRERGTAKVIQHANAVTPELIRSLAAPPGPVREHHRLVSEITPAAGALLEEVYRSLVARDGLAVTEDAARQWARGKDVEELLLRARDSLSPEFPPPPFEGTPRLRPLRTKAEMIEAGARYRNCLRGQLCHAAHGYWAYYEWLDEPRAIVEIGRDVLFGWRLNQVRVRDNRPVPKAHRERIIAELHQIGVHVGYTFWDLHQALGSSDEDDLRLRPVADRIDDYFGH